MWQGWFDFVAGIWLFFSAFNEGMRIPASMIAAGVVVTIFGFWGSRERNSWQGTINGIIGIWLLLSSIGFNLVLPWNFGISGLLICILAIWNILQHPGMKDTTVQNR